MTSMAELHRASTAITIALCTLLAAGACRTDAAIEESAGIVPDTALLSAAALGIANFRLAAVEETDWSDAWRIPARVTLDPATTQPLGSIVEGLVLEMRVFPGDRVKKDQIVAVIHSHEVMDARQEIVAARAAAISADSASAVADAAAARAERLYAANAISLAELERTRAARIAANAIRDAADAELLRAEAYVEHLVGSGTPAGVDEHAALIRAPFDGVVTSRDIQPGQVVLMGQPVATVSREGRLGLLMRLPEQAVASIGRDVTVRFSVAAYPGRSFEARVTRIAPILDSMSRTVDVWALITGDGQQALRGEMTAEAQYPGVSTGRVLTVPAGAIQLYGADTVVVTAIRLGDGLLIEAKPVKVGRRSSLLAEVLSGVTAGDSVVSEGAALARAEIQKRRNPAGDD